MNKNFEYVKTSKYKGFKEIHLNDIYSFEKVLEIYKVKLIYILLSDENEKVSFYFPENETIYIKEANGFESVEDYLASAAAGFKKAENYYKATEEGYETLIEFKQVKDLGIENKEDYLKAKNNGFIKGFETFKKKYTVYSENKNLPPLFCDFDDPVKLAYYAFKQGFKNYSEFERIMDLGFVSISDFQRAKKNSFKDGREYYYAQKSGFSIYREWKEASELKIKSKHEYDNYKELKKNVPEGMSHDQFFIYIFLKNCDNGKIWMRDDLWKQIKLQEEKISISLEGSPSKVLPLWYNNSLLTEDDFNKFLSENKLIRNQGFYDVEKGNFEIFKIDKYKIYMDASNVAFSSRENGKAYYENIKIAVKALLKLGFKDIIPIADASLKHKVADIDKLPHIKTLTNYIEAPANTSADEFLIESAKKYKCFIVSNDTFSDWKIKDRWTALNIDSIRISFIINDGVITFSGLNRIKN